MTASNSLGLLFILVGIVLLVAVSTIGGIIVLIAGVGILVQNQIRGGGASRARR